MSVHYHLRFKEKPLDLDEVLAREGFTKGRTEVDGEGIVCTNYMLDDEDNSGSLINFDYGDGVCEYDEREIWSKVDPPENDEIVAEGFIIMSAGSELILEIAKLLRDHYDALLYDQGQCLVTEL